MGEPRLGYVTAVLISTEESHPLYVFGPDSLRNAQETHLRAWLFSERTTMNGQQGAEQGGQSAQEAHLAYLLNSAQGQAGLMGFHGAGAALLGGQRMGYGAADANLEEQILQRASALRAEALMQQQQQQQVHQRQHHLGAALAALQQQQQLSALTGLNQTHLAALSAQEQEALIGRAAALRELGIAGGGGLPGAGMDRLQQLELNRLEELERRRQQIAALAGLSGGVANARPAEVPSGTETLNDNSVKGEPVPSVEKSAATSAEKSVEDLRKTPGTVIVPCRARGMPMDHNFKTAYFVISEDAKHGEDLVCSYFACRNGGVKFRYCAHCMAPVAKRNFCRRHDHGMSAKTGTELKDEEEDDASMEDADGAVKEDLHAATKKAEKVGGSLDILSKAAAGTVAETNGTNGAKRKKSSEGDNEEEEELVGISNKRIKMWSGLLAKRPRTRDPRHLSSWLNEVLTVSDFETPFDQIEEDGIKNEVSNTPTKKHKSEKEGDPSLSSLKKEKKSKSKAEKKKKKASKPADGASKAKKEKIDTKASEKFPAATDKKTEKAKEPETKPSLTVDSDAAKDSEEKEKSSEDKDAEEEKKSSTDESTAISEKLTEKDAEKGAAKEDETDAKLTEEDPKENEDAKSDGIEKSSSPVPSEEQGSKKENGTEESAKHDDEEGFAESFTAWRDRKKEKAIKKGPGSLKK